MEQLFTALNHAMEGKPAQALAAAMAWGVLSIVLSPCHLASIPLIVGFISEQGPATTRRALLTSTLFAAGILLTIAVIGVVTAAAGRMLGDVGWLGSVVVGLVFFAVGLYLWDALPLPWSGAAQPGMKRKGWLAALILGLVFGLALGPCTFAFMAPVLGVTFQVARTAPVYAAGLLLAYGIGHCLVIVAAGTSTERVQRFLAWNKRSRGVTVVKRVCGLLVMGAGAYLIWNS